MSETLAKSLGLAMPEVVEAPAAAWATDNPVIFVM
jgi:hypothetical protein